jgi:hypothetical protein
MSLLKKPLALGLLPCVGELLQRFPLLVFPGGKVLRRFRVDVRGAAEDVLERATLEVADGALCFLREKADHVDNAVKLARFRDALLESRGVPSVALDNGKFFR